jgi:prefoldin subunit 5
MNTDLLTIAEAQIAEKQYQEIQKVKERLEKDKETLKEAISLVNTHTLYKVVTDPHNSHKKIYKLATEEMLKEDYLKEPKSYCPAGIQFDYNYDSGYYNKGILKVNGEVYYDIRYALNKYEKAMAEKERSLNYIFDKLSDLKKELEALHATFPSLKQAIQEWQEWEEKNNETGN